MNQACVTIYDDNNSCIKLAQNPQEFKRTRHIQVKYHFIRSLVKEGKVSVQYCNTKDQLADLFTKGVNGPRLKEITTKLGIQNNHHGRELNSANYLASTVDPWRASARRRRNVQAVQNWLRRVRHWLDEPSHRARYKSRAVSLGNKLLAIFNSVQHC